MVVSPAVTPDLQLRVTTEPFRGALVTNMFTNVLVKRVFSMSPHGSWLWDGCTGHT